ncbi:MAG: hypothetical protein ACKVP7_24015 [Hyphomicrobiaceae bacterium]
MTIIQKIVRAGDLPPEWAKEFADPDIKVEVRIAEFDEELAKARTSIDVFDVFARQAEKRGLSPEKLDEILNEK